MPQPNSPITIACLPIAGAENPYQQLMMEGLREKGFTVRHGEAGKWFAFTRTWRKRRPGFIHLDWPGSYYLRRKSGLALAQFLGFWLDLAVFRMMGGRLVWTCHNLKEHEVPHPGMDERAKRILGRSALKIRVFSGTQLEKAIEFLRVERSKLVVVPEGSYVGYYPDTVPQAEARKALGLPLDDRIMVNFGNLRPYKGIDRLIEAFNSLKPAGWTLLIAGPSHNPAYVEELKTEARTNPKIVLKQGFVKKEEVQLYMNAADLAVFPFNRIDNSGSVILAMGFRLPVVAPAAGAVKSRLNFQQELLFGDGEFHEKLAQVFGLQASDLQKIGAQNQKNLEKYKWSDFSGVFETLIQPKELLHRLSV